MRDSSDTAATATIDADGVRLAYRLDGPEDAPALVLAHALGLNLNMWDPQVPALAGRFRVVRYDSRGHGRSNVPAGPYTLERLALDLVAVLDALGIEHADVCGISLGGMGVQWVAVHRPDRVHRPVLANTSARIGTQANWTERMEAVCAGGMEAIRDDVVARFLSERFRREHPDETRQIAQMLDSTPAEGYIAACAALRDADLRSQVGSIRAPALLVAGGLDVAVPPGQMQELHAAIAGSELVVLQDAAHLASVEQPETFIAHALAFLGKP
jgi:3-oxoadipate enol-lactonase